MWNRSAFAVQDDYVYYPNYECYYSVSRHQYAYREGNAWVARPAPRGVSVNVLLASPSVKMDFHDSPAQHHAPWSSSIRKIGSRPARTKAGKKTGRTTSTTITGKITENNQANCIRTLKGTLC